MPDETDLPNGVCRRCDRGIECVRLDADGNPDLWIHSGPLGVDDGHGAYPLDT